MAITVNWWEKIQNYTDHTFFLWEKYSLSLQDISLVKIFYLKVISQVVKCSKWKKDVLDNYN